MKTIKRLNIKDWCGYFFVNMTNINDFDIRFLFVNDFKGCKYGSTIFNMAYGEKIMCHILFLIT